MDSSDDKAVMDANACIFELLYRVRNQKIKIHNKLHLIDISKKDSRVENTHQKFSWYRQNGIQIFITNTIEEELLKIDKISYTRLREILPYADHFTVERIIRQMKKEWETLLQNKVITIFRERFSEDLFNQIKDSFKNWEKELTTEEREEFKKKRKPTLPEDADIQIISECVLMKDQIHLLTNDLHFCIQTYLKHLAELKIKVDAIS